MKLKVTNKWMDTGPIRHRLTQGEALVDRPHIILPRNYEGLDISGYIYEMRAVSEEDTLVRQLLCKTVEDNEVILIWEVSAEFTAVAGPLALTVVGMDDTGAEIIKITAEKILVREDPQGAFTPPPPNLLEDALRQMTLMQAAANQARENAETAAQEAAGSSSAAAASAETAQGAANTAAGSSSAAAASAETAQGAANTAAGSASTAAASAEAAAGSAASAAQSEGNAQQYAELASQIAFGQKGWFATPEALKAAYPTGENGWWAIVGTTDTIWTWDSDTSDWVDSGQNVDLSDYYTKAQTDAHINATLGRPVSIQVPAAGWQGTDTGPWTYTAAVEGVSALTELSNILPAAGSTQETKQAALQWQMLDTGAGTVTFTATEKKPTADFMLNAIARETRGDTNAAE